MSVLRLLPILILLPVLAMADDDRNFKVYPNQFKVGETIAPVSGMALKTDESTLVAQKPVLPLQPGKIYLRHKLNPKEFQWVSGKINTKNFQKLNAFNLKKNHLTVYDVVGLRFYATKNAKAFQDETDIYFDKEYVYSSRVPKLFFVKNGQWQTLKSSVLPSLVKFEAEEISFQVASLNTSNDFDVRYPSVIEPGVYVFNFDAPKGLPFVDIGVAEPGKVLVMKPDIPVIHESAKETVNLKVTKDAVAATKTLEETEALHDAFVIELQNVVDVADTVEFESLYPQAKDAALFGIEPDNDDYRLYLHEFNIKRKNAQVKWRESKMLGVREVDEALTKRLDDFQKQPYRGMLMPTSVTATFDTLPTADSLVSSKQSVSSQGDSSVDTTAQKTALQLRAKVLSMYFGMAGARYDVTWNGTVPGVSMDTLYQLLSSNSSNVRVYFSLQNNKPVWVYTDNALPKRYHYRYNRLEVEVNGKLYVGTGSFVLPEHIFQQQEVQNWLNPKPVESSSSEMSSSSMASSSSVEALSSSSVKESEVVQKFVNDKMRGQLALIDSGSFRYYDHVVNMSPFAIMTKEMTQELFVQLMASLEDSTKRIGDRSVFKDAQKPVHNITWNDAREVCKMLDGDLPSEAQWEFAARAGSNEGFFWTEDSAATVNDYAVYYDNSGKLKKTDEAYGPQKVGSKKPNAWGLYDMSGNVSEWTRDRYFMFTFKIEDSNPTGASLGSSKVYKGGSWKDKEKMLNLSTRDDEDPRYWSEGIGFRCVFPREKFEPKKKKVQGK